jgi:FKBP-type peptidyl-prolyl cis-trans isomerase FkpA
MNRSLAMALFLTPALIAGGAQAKKKPAASKLQIKDLKVGKGAEAKPGMQVTVHYTGTLTNGKKFDSSLDRNEPFTFQLGAGQVIKGWDEGVKGMKVGGKRKLVIPPQMAYGERSPGPEIPANSTLVFQVELLGVR